MKKHNSSEVALKVEGVHKSFRLPTEKASGIKQAFINRMRGIKGYTEQHVLRGVSFEIKKGDFFGIVGRNGSGKSTLLKLISEIYTPDKGKITVNGKLVPFIELGVGFNPELTGLENVYLNGALLGFSEAEIDGMYDDIVDFAELHDFMDQKLKNYSSGMQVRLAFSVAIKAQADILVLDEVLAVGDEAFQRKCYQYFAELKKNKKTVILVTHDMDAVQRFCSKAIMIEDGSIVAQGNPAKVAQHYRELFMNSGDKAAKSGDGLAGNRSVDVEIDLDQSDERLIFDILVRPKVDISDAAVVFLINSASGERLYRWSTDLNNIGLVEISRDFRLKIDIQNIFPVDSYYAGVWIVNKDRTKNLAVFDNLMEFSKHLKPTDSKWDINWKPDEKFNIENVES